MNGTALDSVHRRAVAVLVSALCLIAFQYLPFHVLEEAHHQEAAHGHTHTGQHGSDAPTHPALDHQSGPPAGRLWLPGGDLAALAPVALAPAPQSRAWVARIEARVPPSPDLDPDAARGPPLRRGIA